MDAITELDATALSARLAEGSLTVPDVMAAVLDRIDAHNPKINAVVSLRPREVLMAEAKAAQMAPRKGRLHGVPMALKDLAPTAGLRTTWGSPLFADFVPEEDGLLAARLKAAGAIVIGKTNTPEFGLGSHTFNPVHGLTCNPYDVTRSAGGSSGGAAAALAARLVPVADGSDMMGSLRNPAAFCNVYGFRPSWGLVPADPVGDMFLHQLSTEGPMARSPRDLAAVLDVIAGPDPRVPHARIGGPFAETLRPSASGTRIGWLGDWGGAYPVEPGIVELCETALSTFADLGAEIVPLAPPFPASALWEAWITLRSFAIASGIKALWDVPQNREAMKPALRWEIERGLAFSAAEVHQASLIRSDWYRALADVFEGLDALALPAAQVWPFPAAWDHPHEIAGWSMDTYHRWMEIVVPVSLAGLPALALPAGFGPRGLPMGLQLFGPRGGDADLLALGEAYHRATDWPGRAPPPP